MPPSTPTTPSAKKNRFSKNWVHQHLNDPYVQEAQKLGYRSRAAFKLIELAQKDKLFRDGMSAVDLGSAPGSWSQVLQRSLGARARIVALDISGMEPIHGVRFIQGDFRAASVAELLRQELAGAGLRKVDLVVSDLAPNLSGVDSADQARIVHLAELALEFAGEWLQPNGDFVVKVFQGTGFQEYQTLLATSFDKVYVRKPKASRDRSREVYLVGKRRKVN